MWLVPLLTCCCGHGNGSLMLTLCVRDMMDSFIYLVIIHSICNQSKRGVDRDNRERRESHSLRYEVEEIT
jgi:hypothetical protein